MRLYLDDERPTPDGWTRAYTAREAIERIAAGGVVEISLDHDLGDDDAGTGYTVALWIEEAAAFGRLGRIEWSVHSGNPVGRVRMEAALNSAERWWREREEAR